MDEVYTGLWQAAWPEGDDLEGWDLIVNAAYRSKRGWIEEGESGEYRYPEVPEGVEYIELGLTDDSEFDRDQQVRVRSAAKTAAIHVGYSAVVLIHCYGGWNRSGLVVARTLMYLGYEPERAIQRVRERVHPMALSNPTFTAWLMREGPSLQADLTRQEEEEN